MNAYSYLADLVVVGHALYVGFVVFGLLAILLGLVFRWRWVRNFWFRTIHLAMIAVVVVEAVFGIPCPLTLLESHWRHLAGETVREGSFVGRLAHKLLFYDAPQWMFSLGHCIFGAIVILTFVLAPPSASRLVPRRNS